MNGLPVVRNEAPRKKFRGKRRYFRRVWRRARAFRLDADPSGWWDLWHYHADWRGWGNLAWRYRREHLLALVEVFKSIVATEGLRARPFQAWLHVNGADAGQDAVYLHTPNPNHDDYPCRMSGLEPAAPELAAFFARALHPAPARVWRSRWVDEDGVTWTSCSVELPGVGEPLSAPEAPRLASERSGRISDSTRSGGGNEPGSGS